MRTLERLTGLSAARERFGEKADRLLPFFLQTDPLADGVAAEMASLPRDQAQRLLNDAIVNASPNGDSAFDALSRQVAHVPFWVDRERCNRGGAVIIKSGLLSGVALMGSLAKSYCSAGGNKPLMVTGALIHQTSARLARTAEFVRVVSQRDAFLPGAAGVRAALHVRLAHAHVRRQCLRSSDWPTMRHGHPVNQADMAATVLLFSEQMVRNIRALGGVISHKEESDVLHLWRYIGYLMGVEAELLCAEPKESSDLADLFACIDAGPDEDSRKLITALFTPPADLETPLPRGVAEAALALYKAACRRLIGDAHADAVGLPNHGLSPLLSASRVGIRAATSAIKALPLGHLLQTSLGESYWQRLSVGPGARATGATHARQ